jgi:ribosomal protein S21
MARANVRVEAKSLSPHASQSDRDHAFRILLTVFKRRCNEYGVMKSYKEHEYFESKPEKDRRKRKESELRRLKEAGLTRGLGVAGYYREARKDKNK